jgi:hypothetical protein
MHFAHYSPFSDSFFIVLFLRSFVLVLSRVSRVVQFFGMGELWALSDLCEDCHPIEVAGHFSCHYFFSPVHDAVLAIVPPPLRATIILDTCDIWSIMSGSNPLFFLSLGT